MSKMLTFVIPAKNEEDSVSLLYSEIINVLKDLSHDYEIIFVDDGSSDKTFSILEQLHLKDKKVKVIKFRGNWGKSVALQVAFEHSKGDVIFTLDADLQDNPKEIPRFIEKLEEGYDLVSGWKKIRHDPLSKVIPSRVLNYITRKLTGIPLHDINCGFKAYRKDVVVNLNLYGELYRFIPIIAAKGGFKVAEIPVEHRARQYGKSKFGGGRFVKGLLDLLTIVFLTGYTRRPGHFFGTFGIVSFLLGFVIGLYITYLRITTGDIQNRHPLLFLGMLLMIVGVQLISTGLLAEMLLFSRHRQDYSSSIKNKI